MISALKARALRATAMWHIERGWFIQRGKWLAKARNWFISLWDLSPVSERVWYAPNGLLAGFVLPFPFEVLPFSVALNLDPSRKNFGKELMPGDASRAIVAPSKLWIRCTFKIRIAKYERYSGSRVEHYSFRKFYAEFFRGSLLAASAFVGRPNFKRDSSLKRDMEDTLSSDLYNIPN